MGIEPSKVITLENIKYLYQFLEFMQKSKLRQILQNKMFWFMTIIIVMLLWQYLIINSFSSKNEVSQVLKDDCGITVNNIIMHTIDDESRCMIECRNFCQSIDRKYKNSYFTLAEVGCHLCECKCR